MNKNKPKLREGGRTTPENPMRIKTLTFFHHILRLERGGVRYTEQGKGKE